MRKILKLFSEMLNYPGEKLLDATANGIQILLGENPEASDELRKFASFVENAEPGRVEEIYAETFELNPFCSLYIGYHLFGESYKRSVFLLKIKEEYSLRNFSTGKELPDHLSYMLNFLSLCDDADLTQIWLEEAIFPVVEQMVRQEKISSPHSHVLKALKLFLEGKVVELVPLPSMPASLSQGGQHG